MLDNMSMLLGVRQKLDVLRANHPKFFGFINAVRMKGIKEGSIFEIKVTTPEGETLETAIKLTESDMEVLKDLLSMSAKG